MDTCNVVILGLFPTVTRGSSQVLYHAAERERQGNSPQTKNRCNAIRIPRTAGPVGCTRHRCSLKAKGNLWLASLVSSRTKKSLLHRLPSAPVSRGPSFHGRHTSDLPEDAQTKTQATAPGRQGPSQQEKVFIGIRGSQKARCNPPPLKNQPLTGNGNCSFSCCRFSLPGLGSAP